MISENMSKIIFSLTVILFLVEVKAQFGTQHDISMSTSSPADTKAFDLDGDGDLDLISASYWDDKISWHENLGGGMFGDQKIISSIADGAWSVYASDLDGDGDLDVISGSWFDNKIAWYENLGSGNFSSEQIIDLSSVYASSVHAADLDGDGDMDVLSASWGNDKVAWYENLGGGAFGSQQLIAPSNLTDGARSVYASDLDGDGDIDVLAASYLDDKIAWYENLGAGAFGSEIVISSNALWVRAVYTSDLDGDGDLDVLSASESDDKIAWYENLGGGSFGTEQIISSIADEASSVYTSDLDGDGDLDVLSASFLDDKIAWYENLGGGIFGSQQVISLLTDGARSVYAADLNGDGKKDVISSSFKDDKISWYENMGSGTFGTQQVVNSGIDSPLSIFPADLDNDGDIDVVTTSDYDNKVVYYMNLGGNNFSSENIVSTNTLKPTSVWVADLDGDGLNDIVSTSSDDDKLAWYKNIGGGSFGAQQVISISADGASTCFVGDLDGDGDLDIVVGSANDDKVAWYANQGGGTFGVEQVISTMELGVSAIYSVDLDGDLDLDILSASFSGGTISWYENQGGAIFGSQQIITSLTDGAKSVFGSDLDNDGDFDVLSASWNDDKIAWYENLGGGSFGSQQIITISTDYARDVYTSDLDSDGDMDVLSVSNNDYKVAWYENLGGGNFGLQNIISLTSNGPTCIRTADLDGDGDQDVLASSISDDKIAWYENYFGSAYQIKGKMYYDANQDGQLDTNEIGLQFMRSQLMQNSLTAFTSQYGNYFFAVDTGIYNVNYLPNNLWNLTSDSSNYTALLSGTKPIVDSLNFGFYPDTIMTVIEPILTGGFPRCNTIINYWISALNEGTTIPSGIIHLQLADSLVFVNTSVTPDSVVGQDIYWSFDSLYFNTTENINVQVQMPPFTNIGNTLKSYLNVLELDISGNTVYTNVDSLSQIVVCAYDPNDKTVSPIGLGDEGFVNRDQSLEYLIRFQNTGNDTAINIMVRDQLSEFLDWNSLQPLASSHPMSVSMDGNGEVVFEFENIMLPDSNVNELASHGFVKFKVDMLPSLPAGTQILNTGNIFFDANPAVVTNATLNTIYECIDQVQFSLSSNVTCQYDSLSGLVSDDISVSEFLWEINPLFTIENAELNIPIDTAGTFQLLIQSSNSICTKDTIVSIQILNGAQLQILDTTSICYGDSIMVFGHYQSVEGIYYDSLNTVTGCDSVLAKVINYYLDPQINSIGDFEICSGDSLILFGDYVSNEGIVFDTLQSINGCDSIISANLLVNIPPVIVFQGSTSDTLCVNNGVINLPTVQPANGTFSGTGVINNDFDPSISGVGVHQVYYSFTDINGCVALDSVQIDVESCSGIESLDEFVVTIQPNPFDDFATIRISQTFTSSAICRVYDIYGKEVISQKFVGNQINFHKDQIGQGVFLLVIINDSSEMMLYRAKLIAN